MARNPIEMERWRIRFLMLGMMVALALLLLDLQRLQVRQGPQWEQSISKQSIRRVRLPERRGKIFDRQGEVLVDNRANHHLSLWLEELRQPGRGMTRTVDKAMDSIDELAWRLRLPTPVQRQDVIDHFRQLLPFPFKVWEDVDPAIIARFAEQVEALPGVGLETEAKREYPHGTLASHVLGYVRPVGRDPQADEGAGYHYYLAQLEGRAGLERLYNEALSGQAGGQSIRVDVFGYRHEVLATRLPVNGDDLVLNLDLRIQQLAESVLGEERGAAVVMDPRNGEVLAMATSPRFDPNLFAGSRISSRDWNRYNQDPDKPFLNRAVQNHYPPGSVFKPVVALAGMESGRIHPVTTEFHCPGHFQIGRTRRYCGTRSGHGDLALVPSIEGSCNVYYWKMMEVVEYAYVERMAAAFGFGSVTGVEVESEVPGRLPGPEWKRNQLNEGWSLGDSMNVAIGQGYLDVTPMQMAVSVAAIANGGTVWTPRLVRAVRDGETGQEQLTTPVARSELKFLPRNIDALREGMRRVVMSDDGTGRLARVDGVEFAGKTGTAQFGRRSTWRTWMVGFAPFDRPRYAMVVFLEEQPESSGLAVGPLMQELVSGLFALEGEG